MTESVESQIKSEICPDGIWELSDRVKNVLRRQIGRLPNKSVSKEETMFPSTASGMRAFLEVFFSRHYFQVQNSLLDYVASEDFYDILDSGEIRILDVGCGPAVGAMAVTDIVMSLLENRNSLRQRPVRFVYVLNDTSGICLATGQRMLNEYFDLCRINRIGVGEHKIMTLAKGFPDNTNQLVRIEKNYGAYHLIMFSYVIHPLADDNETIDFANDIVRTEELCDPCGRILILQDKYRESLIRILGEQINASVENKELTQEIFPIRGTANTYTYTYYQCLYKPCHNLAEAVACVAQATVFEGV
jgi:ribosomal protein RSM22 (predicted rRNA methylase)